MATPANLAQLQDADLAIDAAVAPSDLLVVVRGEPAACDDAIAAAEAMLQSPAAAGDGDAAAFRLPLTSIALGVERAPGRRPRADLGARRLRRRRGDEGAGARPARDAVLRQRVGRRRARDQDATRASTDLLVMGPDCGTAIVNGMPLGFANVVRRGDIGLVAASGTGLQEVTCRIHNAGRRRLAGARHRRARSQGRDRRHHDAAGARGAGRRPAHARDRADLQAAGAGDRAPDRRRGRARPASRSSCISSAPTPRRRARPASSPPRRCSTRPTWRWRSPAARRRRPPARRRRRRDRGGRRLRRRDGADADAPCAGSSPAARSATRRSSRSRAAGSPCRSNAPADGALPLDGTHRTATSSSTWATTTTRAAARTR